MAQNGEDAATVPIIAMTADAFDKEKQETVAAGMNSHMAKPIEPAVLYEVLADCRKGNENKVFFLCRR